MTSLAHSFFSDRIAECCAAFDNYGVGVLRWLGLQKRSRFDERDRIPTPLRPHYEILLNQGHVVWGSVAQVNSGMFRPGSTDLPGVTVYSSDPHYDANPQDLFAVGRACFQLKNTSPVDPAFRPIAAHMTDEYDSTVRMVLPQQLTDGRQVFAGTTMFHRSRCRTGAFVPAYFPSSSRPT